jgi:CPA1 family monovalent cation:H+ antiporter
MSIMAQTILAFFTLLLLSIGAFMAARRLRVPYTVLLVVLGLLLVPLSHTPTFDYLAHFKLTPDVLFFIFLPILIFESAYNMNIRDIGDNIWSISLLSVLSLVLSAFFIAIAGHYALLALDMDLPFMVLLLFGALISATDPVAVLALFKEFGAPKRLSLIFEGESLFNDGTGLALFLVVLEVALKGFHGASTLLHGVFIFTSMLVGGTLFGFLMGGIFTRLLRYARHEHLQLTITLAAAHLTFLLSELISGHLTLFGEPLRLSSIVATVITSIVLGAESRYRMSPSIREYMERFWGYAAFVSNSLVFILLGLMFSVLAVGVLDILPALAVIIVVVIAGRIVSVYPVIGALNLTRLEAPIPRSWQKLLAWGSFRGALAVMMVLLIPDDYVPEGWRLAPSAKEFIMALTIGCIYFTLFIKATTMSGFLKRFRVTDMQALEHLEYQEGKVYLYARSLLRLLELEEKPYIDRSALEAVRQNYAELYRQAYAEFAREAHDSGTLFEHVLRIHAIGIEKHALQDLFAHGAMSEVACRRAMGKLERQLHLLDSGQYALPATDVGSGYWSRMRRRFGLAEKRIERTDMFLYYRSLAIAAHEVIESFSRLAEHDVLRLFQADAVFSGILDLYRGYEERALGHARELMASDKALEAQQMAYVEGEIANAQSLSLLELESSDIINHKVKTVLAEEFGDNGRMA